MNNNLANDGQIAEKPLVIVDNVEPPLDTVSQGRRESGLQQMHPEALQNVRKRAFEMLDAGMNCVEIARKLSAHPQTIRKWKKHRETFGEELSVIGLKRGPKKLRPEVL